MQRLAAGVPVFSIPLGWKPALILTRRFLCSPPNKCENSGRHFEPLWKSVDGATEVGGKLVQKTLPQRTHRGRTHNFSSHLMNDKTFFCSGGGGYLRKFCDIMRRFRAANKKHYAFLPPNSGQLPSLITGTASPNGCAGVEHWLPGW